MTKHWVVLEAGAKQDYIYDSDRMRHVVGASQLVLDAGTTWVTETVNAVNDPDGADGAGPVRRVQSVSGKAVLLVESEAAGRDVIRKVTRRALAEAPGLEVTGAVGPPFDDTVPYRVRTSGSDDPSGPPADHVAALRRTFAVQGRARAARPARQLRDPRLPWHEPCRETGMPAAGLEPFGAGEDSWHPGGAATLAKATARRAERTRNRLRNLLGTHEELLPVMVDELTEDGWIAVVHADGNGVGALMHDFPDRVGDALGTDAVSLDDHVEWLGTFSDHLQDATEKAFTASVEAAVAEASETIPEWSRKGRLLPILLGGDDVTFACHAALALPLVRAFLGEFARRTRADEKICAIAGPSGMSAAAGVAIVKRHHPFSAAYDLAEELAASAKRDAVRQVPGGIPVNAFDVHVAHESTLRDLKTLRDDLVVDAAGDAPVARHGGPYVVGVNGAAPVPPALAHRDERHLVDVMHLLTSGTLSSARAHDLRGALDRGSAEYRARVRTAVARTSREHGHRGEELDLETTESLLAIVPEGTGGAGSGEGKDEDGDRAGAASGGGGRGRTGGFVRLPDALLLHGVLPRGPEPGPSGDGEPPAGIGKADDEEADATHAEATR